MVNLDLYPLGWMHFLASVIALLAGAVVLFRPKGTPVHRRRGRIYVVALVLTSLTSLGIYRLGPFFFPHWFAIVTLAVVALGFCAVHFKIPRSRWMHLHLTCMVFSYYLLVAGGVNEVFLRIEALRNLASDVLSSRIGMTHSAVIMFFAALIAYFNAAILLRSRAARA